MYTIYIHPTCYSSYRLIKGLGDLAPKVSLRLVINPAVEYMRRGIFSVPMVFDPLGKALLADPVDAEDLRAHVEGSVGDIGPSEALENALRGIMASQFLLLNALVHGSIAKVVDGEALAVLSRLRYHGREDLLPSLEEELRERDQELFRENLGRFLRAAAYGLVRELYWLGIDVGKVEKGHVALWLLSKASIGRVSLPPRPRVSGEVVEGIHEVLSKEGNRYYDMVRREQEEIFGDEEYMALVTKYLGNVS